MQVINIKDIGQREFVVRSGGASSDSLTAHVIKLEDTTINGTPCKIGYDAELDVLVIGEVEQEPKKGIDKKYIELGKKIIEALGERCRFIEWRITKSPGGFLITAFLSVLPFFGEAEALSVASPEFIEDWENCDFDLKIEQHIYFVFKELKSKMIK